MKAILVDDEQLALDFLEYQLGKVGGIEVIGKYNNLQFYEDNDQNILGAIDVIFLDIEMPEMNGVELAEKILEENPAISVVFVTAYNEYAVQAFALHVMDYVMKPVQVERLRETVKRIHQTREESHSEEVCVEGNFLRVTLCNELAFETTAYNDKKLRFRTAKAQELFLYLLLHSNRTVRKAELIELLWSDFIEERALSQLYTAIYHIRKVIRPFQDYIGIHNNQAGYRLWTNNLFLDVVFWESKIKAASPITIENIEEHESCMELYTGPYLGSYNYTWAEAEQHRLEHLWVKTAHQMASVYEKNNRLGEAVEWYVRICSIRPEDEDSQFALMKAYATMGIGMFVTHQYKELKNALEELGLEVNKAIADWYVNWQK